MLVEGDADLQWNYLGTKPTQDWTVHHAVFNSREFSEVGIYFGVWGAGKGRRQLLLTRPVPSGCLHAVTH